MDAMASQITSLTIVYSTVYSGADQSKHQSSASLAFVWGSHRGPVNSPQKWPVKRKMFPSDDVIMRTSCWEVGPAMVAGRHASLYIYVQCVVKKKQWWRDFEQYVMNLYIYFDEAKSKIKSIICSLCPAFLDYIAHKGGTSIDGKFYRPQRRKKVGCVWGKNDDG